MPFLQLLSSVHRRTSQQLLVLILFVVSMFLGVTAANAAPGPNVPTLGNQDIFLGSPASFVFNFSNSGPDIGYGPFIELALDTSGPDGATTAPLDGYGTPAVTVAGLKLGPVASIPVTGINFVNPLTGETRPVPAGFGPNDTIFIYALPFGSFTPGQSTRATITVPTSNRADIGTPLPIAITPGFRDDAASLAGPAFYGASSTGSATPVLYSLKKIYLGPEDETATGPNFPRRYRLEVDVATGQTVSNLVVTDDLATSMQITGRDATHMFASTAAGGLGSNIFTAANAGGTAVTTTPDGTLSYSFGSVTGVDGVDAVFEFEFYVPRDTSGGTQVLPQDATSGTDSVLATNTSNSSLDWTPIDSPRDPVQTAVPPAPSKSTLNHVLEEQSIAIQKIAAAIDPATGNPTTKIIPGTTLIRYTLNFQVSDYYALQNVQVNDVLADGLRLFTGTRGSVNAGLPTLAVNNAYLTGSPAGSRVNVPSADFGGGTIDYQRRYTLQSALPSGTASDPTSFPGTGPTDPAFSAATVGTINGSTLLNFDISAELIRRLGANAGRLLGGEINNDGTGPDNDPFAGPNLGGTSGTIVFYAEVNRDFSDDFLPSDRSVNQGDLFLNTVDDPLTPQRDGIIADQIRPADINAAAPTVIGIASDDSGAELEIGYGETSKTIERINGQTVAAQTLTNPPFSVQPGDRITYKLSYTLPIDSYEQLRLRDYPPLPVMPVGAAGQYSLETGAPSYNAYTVAIAPDDTFFSTNSFVGTAVNLTTAAALTGATYSTAGNGSFTFATTPTVDGAIVTGGMRILVKNQVDTTQNGVYLATTPTSWLRATDMDIESEVESSQLYAATLGSTNANIYYVQSNNQFSLFNDTSSRGQIIFEPFISTSPTLNEILLNFGNFNNPSYNTVKLSVLLTLPVGSDPFSTDLLLTNQLRVNEASTNNGTSTVEDVRRYQLVRPNLAIQKGVVGANTTGFILGGIAFTAPNAAANFSGGPVYTPTQVLAIGARDIDLFDALDAGDEVRYAIVAQNSGKGDAFDTILNDTIPIEYNRATFNPATDLVLRRGDATQLTTSAAMNGFVRVATITNLGGSFNAAIGGGQFSNVPLSLIDGQKITVGDRILVKNQTTASQNGIYSVTAIDLNANTFTLTRSTDANIAAALSGYRVAVAGGLNNADQHFQLSAVTTLNADPVNAGAALGVRDYYTIYNPTTGNLQILLSDNYTAGNIGGASEDNRNGSLSRGLRTDQTNGDTAIINGSNTIIAMYDVVLQPTVEPNQVIPNTASILSYSNSQGGPDYTNPVNIPNASDPSESAQVIVKLPLMAKTLVSTEVTTAGNNGTGGPDAQATIGEYITYKVTLTVPEGVSTATQIVDTLDVGLAFVDLTGVTASSGLSFASGGLPTVSATPANTTINTFAGDAGRQIVFNFGTITNNTNVNNAAPETIEMSYRAVVLNTLANQQTQSRNNAAQLSWQNNSGTVISVSAGQSSSLTGSTFDAPTPVTIVEPTLTNLKDVRNVTQGETFPAAAGTPQQTRGDAGDTMEYRITIANPATGSTTAYDASLSDLLPTSYFPGGFTISSVSSTGTIRFNGTARAATAADFVITAGSLQFIAGLDVDIDPAATITILVQGTGFTGATGQLIDNIADLRWSSLDGTAGTRSTYNTNSTERTGADGEIGSGTLNDYRDTDNAVIESPPIVRKTLVSTSEAHTNGSNVAIGEIVRFRLVASVAEGTSANYQVQDFMPTGMSFLNDGTARWALVSDGGNVIASTAVGSVPSLGASIIPGSGGISGDQANLNAITSSQIIGTFADANISTDANGAGTGDAAVYADGADVFFRFGTLANTDNDTDVEYVIVEFNALVRNQTSNQAGTNLANSMTILTDTNNDGSAGYIDVVNDTNGDGVGSGEATIPATDADNNADLGTNTAAQSTPAIVTVVEPNLTINKQVIATTGSVVTYRITLTNPSTTNASTGYNLRVIDILPAANLTLLNPATLTANLTGGATGATNNSSGNTVDFTINVLPVGGSVTIDYSATVLTTPTGATSIDNTANATDTSLPGLSGTGGDWAGTGISSTVPGTSGSATGERTGQDGVAGALNDYAVRDTERLGSLGDRVYYDANANGAQGAITVEPGLVGVPVTVTWAGPDNDFATTGDNAVITVNTGANGIWSVAGLPLGATQRYRVSVPTIFSGMGLTDVRDTNGVSTNPDGVGVGISAITLTGADLINGTDINNRIQDFGYRGTASLGNRIYIDADGDGVQDTNGLEPSLPGVVTTLLWAGPDNNFTTTADNLTFTRNSTNAATNYLYSNLPAGDFRVTVSATGGSGGVPDNMSLTDALDNSLLNTDPNGLGAGIIQTNLTTGENEVTIDFGYKGTASIGDYVWYDVNGNGVQDADEPPIVGATVTLLWSGPDGNLTTTADNVTFTTTTDATGKYLFPSLPVNGATDPYRVTVTQPAAYPTQTYDKDGTGTANNSTLNLAPTENNLDQDFGYRGTAQLGNLVWEDLNGNGRQDAGEPGIDGVAVDLYFDRNNDGDFADAGETTPLASTTTAAGGAYSFTNLPYGNYQVVFGNGNGTTTYNRTVVDSAVATDATDSDANVSTGRTGTYTLSSVNTNNQTVDAGLIRLVSLGDCVYYDLNNDGIQQPSELGIKDATVTVTWLGPDGVVGGGDDVVYPGVTTDSDGKWTVSGLPPGSFQVAVTNLPAGVTITDSIDNGGAVSALNPVVISTNSGVNRTDIDFGFRGNGSIGDHVFLDLNNNGTFDAGEGIANVTVTLKGDINGDGIDDSLTTTTDADGFYQFNNLRTSDSGVNYTVTIDTTDLPQDGAGNPLPNTVDPDTSGTGNNTSSLSLTTTTPSNQNQDFGYRGLGQIGDTIFLDVNSDNQLDAGEGISGVKVTLSGDLDGDGTAETFTSTTNASGVYDFSYLPVLTPTGTVINYTVTVDTSTLPASVTNTVDPDTANPGDSTSALTLPTTGAPVNLDQDFGYRGTGSIGDRIFLDVDNNGSYTAGEGIANVTVTLTADVNGDGVAETFTTTTDQDGFYQFSNLPIYQKNGTTAVSYTVKVVTATLPVGVSNTVDPDGGLNSTSMLTLSTTNPSNPDQDFGYQANGSIGDTIFLDLNNNGLPDTGEGIAGVTVTLTGDLDGDGTNESVSVTTDSNGQYLFDGLRTNAGGISYTVAVTSSDLPPAVTQTVDPDATKDNQSSSTLTTASPDDLTRDFGYRGAGQIGDTIFLDVNNNGLPDSGEGIAGVNVTLTGDFDNDGANETVTTTTDTNGSYLFSGLVTDDGTGASKSYTIDVIAATLPAGLTQTVDPDTTVNNSSVSTLSNTTQSDLTRDFGYRGVGRIGDTIFLDINNNGVADPGEGIAGVKVTLTGDLDGDGTNETVTATTDTDGVYQFTGLRVNTFGVSYSVAVDTTTLPVGVSQSFDPDGTLNNQSTSILTTAAPIDLTRDFGYRGAGQIGDTIFLDVNNNGLPDTGEGIANVNVTLTGDLDNDGNNELVTVTTDTDGKYLFSGLLTDDGTGVSKTYTINVVASSLPANVVQTTDPDGTLDNQSTSTLTTATPTDLTRDFGYRGPGSIGDRIFLDINNNGAWDVGEGIDSVKVTLKGDLDGDGTDETVTTTTDSDGLYTFGGLRVTPAGVTYTVSVDTTTLPAGISQSFDPDGTSDNLSTATLTDTAPNNLTRDFGYRGTASLGDRVWIDSDGDGVQDAVALEPSLPGISMQLTWAGTNGTFGDADDVTSTMTTDSTGAYNFTGLPAGKFQVNVDTNSLPANMSQTYDLDGLGSANLADRMLTQNEAATDLDFGYRGNASLGDRVWLDQNGNGIQEASEVGLPGATIQVTWFGKDGVFGGGDDVIFNTTTGANGAYLLEGLPANALVGSTPNYRVEVTGGIIAGLDLTDSIDNGGAVSPVNPVDIQVSPVEGNLLNDRRDVDFGYDGLSSLAGTVFRDDNNNGVQDGGEPGIGGVTLTLTGVDVLGNPYIDPSTGQPYVAITDANGNYSFPTVVPGTYTITETQPGNYNDGIDTAGSLGGNAGNDVISGIPVGANQAGIAYNFGEIGTFISGIVFRDDNRDGVLDASETTGLGGVTIQLYDSTGTTLIATTTTAVDGSYRFDNIAIGSYQVRETQPGGYASSPTGPFAPDTRTVSVPAAGLPNQNFGEILASISGVVYIDANNDGLRDASDTGRIGNVPVTLTGTDINNNPVNLTVYTDASGAYRFDNIFPSDASGYTITEGSAAPYSDKAANPGTATGGSAGTASDANTIAGIGLTAGSQGVNYDFGEIQPSSTFISGSVYRDDNKNGLRDTNEPAIPNTTITLYDAGADGIFGNADDGPAQTTTTDANGNYLFPNLITGRNYQVVETQPAAYGNSPAGPTTLIAVNALPAAGSSNNNFGEVLGSLAGLVYFDANNNGAFDSGETGIAGTTVSLSGTDINGNPVSLTATTAADGSYRFDNLPAGSYTVTETQPAGYADGSETVGSSGGSTSVNDEISAITLSAGQNATSYNFGEVGVSVSGLIFYDTNRNGTLDGSETVRIPNVSVQLIDKNGNVVATSTTAADGSYIFTNVPPGDYTIVEQQPTGYGDPLSGSYAPNSRPITVSNTNITDQNFGDTLSTLAGSVYVDTNNNGIREGGEAGISGVPVRLDWAGPDGIFGTADDVTGLDTTTTGSNGGYLFTELLTGVYRVVEVSQPAAYTDGLETAGSDGGNTATNEQISAIPVAAGTDLTDYNFGEVPPANPFISGSVYIDSNNNGIRDPGEPGIPGVTVTLTGPGGATVTTDANGNYVFINLTAGSNYTITETQPNEYGNGLENSTNIIPVNGLPSTGSSNNNFGEIPGSISGVVYFDKDSSGTLAAGDTRLPRVTLSLQDGNGNPVNNPLTGQPYVVVTGADGSYRFENLPAGNYRVVETQPSSYNDGAENPGAGNTSTVNDRIDVTLAAGASSTDNNFAELGAALSGTVWVDTDRDGTIDGAETGRISGVTIKLYDKNGNLVGTATTASDGSYSFPNLPPGDYTIVQEQPNAYGSSTSNTIAVSLTKMGLTDQNFGETLGSLSGLVYADVNRNGIHDAGEPGIPNVPVELTGTDINNNPVTRTTTTDANGNYSFGDLPAGSYKVVETQPAGYNDGQDQLGSAGGILTNDTISTVPLGAGVNATDYNFGEVSATISGTVWLDRDRDGSLDAGEPDIGTITIELRNNNGDLIATTTTNSDGSYSFIGLPGGDYQIIELQPNGYGSTTSNTISVTVPNDGLISNQNFGDSLASVNGAVYIDANADGVRDVGEVGISGVTINLTGTDLNGNPVTRTVTTDNNGAYSFGDLLAGSYTVIESQPANYGDGLDAIGSAGGSLNNDTAGNIVITPGLDANGYNFGEGIPTAIVLAHFSASHEEAGVMLRWVTSVELNTWGFQVYRSTNAQRQDAVLVTPTLIVAQGRGQGGAQYEWLDTSAEAGVTYSYWLLETELDGQIHEYGPAQTALTTAADSGYRVLLPLVMR